MDDDVDPIAGFSERRAGQSDEQRIVELENQAAYWLARVVSAGRTLGADNAQDYRAIACDRQRLARNLRKAGKATDSGADGG